MHGTVDSEAEPLDDPKAVPSSVSPSIFESDVSHGFEFSSHGGHSADVRINLILNGDSIPVAQLGPGFLLLDAATDHPPGPASSVLRVDQSERRWNVRLPDGISAQSKRVVIVASV